MMSHGAPVRLSACSAILRSASCAALTCVPVTCHPMLQRQARCSRNNVVATGTSKSRARRKRSSVAGLRSSHVATAAARRDTRQDFALTKFPRRGAADPKRRRGARLRPAWPESRCATRPPRRRASAARRCAEAASRRRRLARTVLAARRCPRAAPPSAATAAPPPPAPPPAAPPPDRSWRRTTRPATRRSACGGARVRVLPPPRRCRCRRRLY